jgi:hypothetical protein
LAHTKNKKKDKNFLLYFRIGHGGLCRRTAVRILIGHKLDSENKREKTEKKIVANTGGVGKK